MKYAVIAAVFLSAALIEAAFIRPVVSNNVVELGERIIEGFPAVDKQFPYVVHISVYVGVMSRSCGGSLISQYHILTSASCLQDGFRVRASFGSIDRNTPFQEITTDKFIQHPQYDPATADNDVGIVDLIERVSLSDRIQTIALPRFSQISESFVNSDVVVAGWGYVSVGTPSSQYLKYANLSVIKNEDCKDSITQGVVNENTLCATSLQNPQQVPCSSDDGSALVLLDKTENILIQIGIVSSRCSNVSRYIRPQNYLLFISNYTGIPIRS